MEETLNIIISKEDKLKLLQEAETLRMPLSSYCRMKLGRESNTNDLLVYSSYGEQNREKIWR